MKKILLLLSVWVLCPAAVVLAGEFRDSGAALAVDFPSGWAAGHSDDPAVVLKLENGESFFEFARLDSELSDYYLKARVKEQVDSFRSKGNSLAGDVLQAGIHGVSTAYYTSYDSMGVQVYIAFFTYNGVSYAISASGLDNDDFRNAISTIRKPGEIIEIPRPRKIKMAREKNPEPEEGGARIFRDSEPADSAPVAAPMPAVPSEPVEAGSDEAVSRGTAPIAGSAGNFLAKPEVKANLLEVPFIRRQPLALSVWGMIIALWIAGVFMNKAAAAKLQNPMLPIPPKDVPPDFFFPFIISRNAALRGCTYNVLTRQKQQLLASFNTEYKVCLSGSIYAGIFFHIFWSLLAFAGKGGLVPDTLLLLPGGRLWASAPELLFAMAFIVGLSMYFNKTQALRLYDSQSNFLMEAKKDAEHCFIRNSKGGELARLIKKDGLVARTWDFVDPDGQIAFTVRDDYPATRILRKILGGLGGVLHSRYSIFAAERRAGFVFLDPASADKFQIHLDFDFARLAPPAQMLTSILYIISKENESFYLL